MIKQNPERQVELGEACTRLLDSRRIRFLDIKDMDVPETAGIYVITTMLDGSDAGDDLEAEESVWYVGQAGNLRRRICRNHLNGSENNSRFKKYLIADGQCTNRVTAKAFISRKCFVRWLESTDDNGPWTAKKLGSLEYYVIATLEPKYGIAINKPEDAAAAGSADEG
jgi:hypothetical protein